MKFIDYNQKQIEEFKEKYGEREFDIFNKNSQRLKNNDISTDIQWHLKNTSVNEMEQILENIDNKIEVGSGNNAELIAENDYYKVYNVKDWQTAMKMGDGTVWCITGRYETDEPKPSQAQHYFNEYFQNDYDVYLFCMPKKGNDKYCICIDKDKQLNIWDARNNIVDRVPNCPEINCNGKFIKFLSEENPFQIRNKSLIKAYKNIKKAVIPDTVTYIGDFAFADCSDLTTITIPDSIVDIGLWAFSNCKSLSDLIISDSVKHIGVWAFAHCNLKNIIMPTKFIESKKDFDRIFHDSFQSPDVIINGKPLSDYTNLVTDSLENVNKRPFTKKDIDFWINPKDDTANAIIEYKGKRARLRAGILIIKDDEVLLSKEESNPNEFAIPGGSIEPDETIIEAAIREAQEEVGITVKNAKETGFDYCEVHDKPVKWVKENVPEDVQWLHYYTCLVIGEYDEPYKGKVAKVDKDPSMKNNAKWYKIKDVINKPSFKDQWKKALKGIIKDSRESFFANSKIRDKNGNLLICYHGTSKPGFTEFKPQGNSVFGEYKFNNYNINYFTTNKETAVGYTELGIEENGNVYACYLNIVNPYIVDNSTKAEMKNWKNIQDKKIRQKQMDYFEKVWNKWSNKFIDEDDLPEINKDLFYLHYVIKPSLERKTDDGYGKEEGLYDLYELNTNGMVGDHVIEYSYELEELFDSSMYDEIKEHIIGEDEDDYWFTIDNIIKFVLLMNEEDGTDYDGIIVEDIADIGPHGNMFGENTTDIVTLKSANQIKRITNENPTESNNIDDSEPSKEEVLNNMDKLFGQTELYFWSTFILPNGHFLNPDNSNKLDQPEYEHSDFIEYKDNPYGEALFKDCVKLNATYPYLIVPSNPTEAQYNAIKEICNLPGNLEYCNASTNDDWATNQDQLKEMTYPILIECKNFTKLIDLDKYSGEQVVQMIKGNKIAQFHDAVKEVKKYIKSDDKENVGKYVLQVDDKNKTVFIDMLDIYDDYQHQGFGTQTVKDIISEYKDKGFNLIWAYCDKDNDPAINCYKKLGAKFTPSKDDEDEYEVVFYKNKVKDSSDLVEKAKEIFGTTWDWKKGFYINTDGTMLDGSGKNFGSKGDHRASDHKNISYIFKEADGEDAMLQYMQEGNIRLIPEVSGIEIMKEPTDAQYERIATICRYNFGKEFNIDFTDNSYRAPKKSLHYDKCSANKVIKDIKNYFHSSIEDSIERLAFDETDEDYEDDCDVHVITTPKEVIDFMNDYSWGQYKIVWDKNKNIYLIGDPWAHIHLDLIGIANKYNYYEIRPLPSDMQSIYITPEITDNWNEENYPYEYYFEKYNVGTYKPFENCPLYKELGKLIKTNLKKDSLDQFDKILNTELQNCNAWLSKYGFELQYCDGDYDFGDSVGLFLNSEQDNASVFPIALNKPYIVDYAKDDTEELRYAIRGTIWHEAGHGIFEFLNDIYNLDDLNEEDAVEEFARYKEDSELFHILSQYKEEY